MVKLTFLEVHLEGSSLTANAPFSDRDEDPTAAPETEPEAESAGGRRGVAIVVGLLFLLALAALARRLLADGETIDLN